VKVSVSMVVIVMVSRGHIGNGLILIVVSRVIVVIIVVMEERD